MITKDSGIYLIGIVLIMLDRVRINCNERITLVPIWKYVERFGENICSSSFGVHTLITTVTGILPSSLACVSLLAICKNEVQSAC